MANSCAGWRAALVGLLFPGGILGLVLGAYPARGGYARNRAHGEEGGRAAMEAERPREWRRERASEGERLREPPVARLLTPASADLCESPAGPPRPSDPGLASTRASESGQHARPPALAAGLEQPVRNGCSSSESPSRPAGPGRPTAQPDSDSEPELERLGAHELSCGDIPV